MAFSSFDFSGKITPREDAFIIVFSRRGPLADFQIADIRSVDRQTHGRPNLVKATQPRSARIDVEYIQRLVILHLSICECPLMNSFGGRTRMLPLMEGS